MKALARFVNALAETGAAPVSESDARLVSVHGLDTRTMQELVALLDYAHVTYDVADASEQPIATNALGSGFEPFTISFAKPAADNRLYFVTTRAFLQWLGAPTPIAAVCLAACEHGFATEGFSIGSWEAEPIATETAARKSPRRIVREATGRALVPADVRPFLLVEGADACWTDEVFCAWAARSNEQLVLAVASEVLIEDIAEFVGPPRLALRRVGDAAHRERHHHAIQPIVRWIYDIDREVELRHRLFCQEFARLAFGMGDAGAAFATYGKDALEGAKIAYGFHIHEISKDALKSLADLRKSVAEDTQKVLESMRQISLGAAGALFYVLGILAAKLTSTVDPDYLEALLLLGMTYISAIILVNEKAIIEQRRLRDAWRNRIYRYLTDDDYKDLVGTPTRRVERLHGALLGCITVVICASFTCASWWLQRQQMNGISILPRAIRTLIDRWL